MLINITPRALAAFLKTFFKNVISAHYKECITLSESLFFQKHCLCFNITSSTLSEESTVLTL